ncbi:hypothetical protein DY000_02060915 [Brassica cretica]|uniref:Uncharacterized protein n=1 Tax=Brassica cretica TaxID=69181 RepID=A0ABQ7AR13_BRACR|nr:hypothetical protein DY000_02060915 [Brassica cretica]
MLEASQYTWHCHQIYPQKDIEDQPDKHDNRDSSEARESKHLVHSRMHRVEQEELGLEIRKLCPMLILRQMPKQLNPVFSLSLFHNSTSFRLHDSTLVVILHAGVWSIFLSIFLAGLAALTFAEATEPELTSGAFPPSADSTQYKQDIIPTCKARINTSKEAPLEAAL